MATHPVDGQDPIVMNGNSGADRLANEYIPVSEFYGGRSIFITGGTGFMGKVIKFQIISISDINLLLRKKKDYMHCNVFVFYSSLFSQGNRLL